jgi:hypothetical protein
MTDITVIVPVSVIKSHPNTNVLVETLDSVRHHLKDAELIVTFDGVRPEQADRQADYDEFTRRALWLLDKKYGCAVPYLFDTHQHQSGMMRAVLDEVRTPLLMYVEQDTPLVTSELIAWPTITDFILSGHSNLVRFSHEATLLDCHQHLMHGADHAGLFTRTSQWSQRPHVAATAFYRRLLECYFTPESKSFLEDRLYGVLEGAYRIDGMAGWRQFLTHIYSPEGNMCRSRHTDGRAGEPKWASLQTF